jgi:hypothetical protein
MSITSQSVSEPVWFKSSHSGGNTTECMEVAFIPSGVFIRDSKQPECPHLTVSAEAWVGFLTAARRIG